MDTKTNSSCGTSDEACRTDSAKSASETKKPNEFSGKVVSPSSDYRYEGQSPIKAPLTKDDQKQEQEKKISQVAPQMK